jgi:hypothetical protein
VDIVGSRLPVYRRFVFRQPISEALTVEQAEEPGEKVPGGSPLPVMTRTDFHCDI